MESGIETGYFMKPGTRQVTLVHLVRGGKPICGAKIGEDMEFQWCASFKWLEAVTCTTCRRLEGVGEQKETESAKKVATTREPKPKPNGLPEVVNLVVKDMLERGEEGARRYGTPLQPFNGRDALVDAYQEALDLAVYLRQALFERDQK